MWSVAILSSREAPAQLTATIEAALRACRSTASVVDVVVNGNRALAHSIAAWAGSHPPDAAAGSALRVWFVQFGDKAHAWNVFVHHLRVPGATTFFVDGYVRVEPASLRMLDDALQRNGHALAATGVPTDGPSADRLREGMIRHGGIHGNLYAVRGAALDELVRTGFRLPLALYRTDPLLAAVLNLNLKPSQSEWDPKRIAVVPEATWRTDGQQTIASWSFLRGYFKRLMRQAQGDLENRAYRDHLHLRRLDPSTLPARVRDLVDGWIGRNPWVFVKACLRNPLRLRAAMRLRESRDWTGVDLPPVLVAEAGASVRLSGSKQSLAAGV